MFVYRKQNIFHETTLHVTDYLPHASVIGIHTLLHQNILRFWKSEQQVKCIDSQIHRIMSIETL